MKKTLLFIALCCCMITTAQYDIVYNLEKDGVYPQNLVVTSEQKQVINGMPQDITTIISTESDYIVTGIKDGIYSIDIIVKSMSNTTKSAMGSETMSSDGASSNPMNQMFKNMIKDPIKITMNNKGEILSFDNSAQLVGLIEGMELPEMQLLQIEGAMKKEMSAEKQIDSYNKITQILPTKEVNIGDSWDQVIMISSIATFESTTTYTLESVTDESYIINSSAMIATPKDATTDLMGMKAKYDLAGPLKASYTIDKKTGWIKKANFEQSLDGTVLIEKSETMPQELKMTMTSTTTTVIE
ncbi:hypothetical protein F0365_08960 [Nonlabens sp. Ci31]|jgi:hypothetical protein|uniref:DUF6263 family protein n=1 Tax=Nonlabens sp. Ci31 TaxID=2608253 RepID=UPI0014636CF0|nr:DUF6263 family protein [Nonlabens sp. Ci31]QJP34521.1 hypothetical protein F0365_08960 [Nonlabens sp. Ci31]